MRRRVNNQPGGTIPLNEPALMHSVHECHITRAEPVINSSGHSKLVSIVACHAPDHKANLDRYLRLVLSPCRLSLESRGIAGGFFHQEVIRRRPYLSRRNANLTLQALLIPAKAETRNCQK